MTVPVTPPPAPMASPQPARPRGRRVIRAGIAIMVVTALAIAGSVAAWFLFGKTSTDGAEVVSMPGSFSKDLTAGEWALYTEVVGGARPTVYSQDVTIEGPGTVETEETSGFFSDTTTIEVDGTTYEVILRLDVPEDGTYEFDIARDDPEEVPVVIGQYPDHDVLALVVIWTVLVSMLLGTVGLIVLIVGLVMWATGRKQTRPLLPPPPPSPTGPPPPYPTA